jgi:hypothetical protein
MSLILRRLLLVAALLFSQHAAMLHGLAHAEHDLALATHQDGQAPALGHAADVCAAFGGLAHALGSTAAAHACESASAGVAPVLFSSFVSATRVGFDSRAPPLSA